MDQTYISVDDEHEEILIYPVTVQYVHDLLEKEDKKMRARTQV